MTWRPAVNILRPVASVGAGLTGARNALSWPTTALGGGSDYSIDFDALLAPGEFVTEFRFETREAADIAWTNLFGNIVSAWMRWKASGTKRVTVCVLTNEGNSQQVEIDIVITPTESLFPLPLPQPPGASNPPPDGNALPPGLHLNGRVYMGAPDGLPDGLSSNGGVIMTDGSIAYAHTINNGGVLMTTAGV
ncbi:hypothetical protein [Asaia sp. HN010]|uniref:hypothetical protein n=1 Tax=Asaia sp. HN010 TaxID=3081233 RepID=UPI003019711E